VPDQAVETHVLLFFKEDVMSKFRNIFICFATLSASALMAASAQSAARVNFTKMTVNDCNEIGICDWKLSCALGNQQETEFFSMAEANTNEDVTINRILTQQEFPTVTVTCTAQEFDDGIGAKWEQIGTGSVIVGVPGSHLIRLNQHRDEGDVTVHFDVQATTSQGLSIGGPIKSGAGKCLDVHAPDQNNNGATVQVWDCNSTIQQTWQFDGNAIKSGAGKCLDVHAPDQFNNGGRVQVWDCNNTMQQTWHLEGNAIKSGAGKCLDVHAPDQFNNGGVVQVWDCNNTMQQTWSR
jgi:hypothetical protein